MPGTVIIIRHTRADGTLIEGSRRGDGVWEVLKTLHDNWRSFRSLGALGIGQSRDKAAQRWKIDRAAAALRAAGFTVEVEIDDITPGRSVAEIEADRYERADRRAGYHADRAKACEDEAARRWEAERGIRDAIPMGQPILAGHHSERRHRRDLARADAHAQAGLEATRKRDYHQDRAEVAEHYRAGRENVPAALRRIEALGAEQRQIQRRLDGTDRFMNYGEPATGEWKARLTARLAEVAEELAYWHAHVERRQAEGVKVWSRADFTKGDFVQFLGRWFEVLRVNAKSVTIPAMISGGLVVTRANSRLGWTDLVPYHKVTGRMSADEAAVLLAGAAAGDAG
jgi:hypothetical protein